MASPTRGPGSGWIKDPNPSQGDVVFYTIAFICIALMLWPLLLLALLYTAFISGPEFCWELIPSLYHSTLYGE